MLIEFSVSNFRSIRDRQTLSLVASNREKDLQDNLIQPDVRSLGNTRLVRSAAVYGANASGKSNLLSAAHFMQNFIENSSANSKPGEETGVVPFRLDEASATRPTDFETVFVLDGVRYQYGFSLDRMSVLGEWLVAYPAGQPQRWFRREINPGEDEPTWNFGAHLKGDKRRLADVTPSNALFLSVAAQFTHEQLTPVYRWFANDLRFLNFSAGRLLSPAFSAQLTREKGDLAGHLIRLLRLADPTISDVAVDEQDVDPAAVFDGLPPELKESLAQEIKGMKRLNTDWFHTGIGSETRATFGIEDESSGTVKFFALLGPWLDTLRNGYTVLIDEIGANMHALLALNLIRMIHDPATNPHGAQLVFTTHDTTLLDTSLLRRDQVWFTEKDPEGATVLYPLTDYRPRKDEALQKGYLAGRYGAIPFFGDSSL